jgi:hypothetical protein
VAFGDLFAVVVHAKANNYLADEIADSEGGSEGPNAQRMTYFVP